MKNASKVRNCFVSYHHERVQKYASKLRNRIVDMRVSDFSLKADISHLTDESIYKVVREKIRNCAVTIVLIGERTRHRKWIDWELWASLRAYNKTYDLYKSFKPNGLLGIYLPTGYHSIPDRFKDNMRSGFAVSMKWENIDRDFESKVNYAFWSRTKLRHKIKNDRERLDCNYLDFLGFRI